jgi:hypothetical protein
VWSHSKLNTLRGVFFSHDIYNKTLVIMDNKILNEIKEIKHMMGLTESEVDEQIFQGLRSGKKKGLDKSLEVEEYEHVDGTPSIISTFPDHTTIELTKQASRDAIQKIANDIAKHKNLGEYLKRQVFQLDNGGEKLIVHYNNN